MVRKKKFDKLFDQIDLFQFRNFHLKSLKILIMDDLNSFYFWQFMDQKPNQKLIIISFIL